MKPEEFAVFLGEQRASAILRTSIAEAVEPAMDAAVRGGFLRWQGHPGRARLGQNCLGSASGHGRHIDGAR